MRNIRRGLAIALVVAGFLGSASLALAGGKVTCAIAKDGKKTTQMVATASECTKLGGKVVDSKKGATTEKKSNY